MDIMIGRLAWRDDAGASELLVSREAMVNDSGNEKKLGGLVYYFEDEDGRVGGGGR
jgi:hypothetical protein